MGKMIGFRSLEELSHRGYIPTGKSSERKIEEALRGSGNYRLKVDCFGRVWSHGTIVTLVNKKA
jgi:hypothetical protein